MSKKRHLLHLNSLRKSTRHIRLLIISMMRRESENAKRLKEAFSWNKGYREYFAVKATPNPYILKILKDYGCGVDCASMAELMMGYALDYKPEEIMFSSNDTPGKSMHMLMR